MGRPRRIDEELHNEIKNFQQKIYSEHGIRIKYIEASRALAKTLKGMNCIDAKTQKNRSKKGTKKGFVIEI